MGRPAHRQLPRRAPRPGRQGGGVVAGRIWSPAFADSGGHLTETGKADQDAVVGTYSRFLLAQVLLRTVGPETAHNLLPDAAMDGTFQAIVGRLDLSSGCLGATDRAPARPGGGPPGFGFWVNAVTSWDTGRVADPRPMLAAVDAPVLVLRAECDYIAWEVAREYRDLLPDATMLYVEGAGHAIASDRPELYHEAIRAFLTGEPLPLPPYTGDARPG